MTQRSPANQRKEAHSAAVEAPCHMYMTASQHSQHCKFCKSWPWNSMEWAAERSVAARETKMSWPAVLRCDEQWLTPLSSAQGVRLLVAVCLMQVCTERTSYCIAPPAYQCVSTVFQNISLLYVCCKSSAS
ncbi:TPA: hypothetical protein ACH3X1_015155 [Trebouxia sp. C0004]